MANMNDEQNQSLVNDSVVVILDNVDSDVSISLTSLQNHSSKTDIIESDISCSKHLSKCLIPILLQCSVSLGVGVFVVPKSYINIGLIPGTLLLLCFAIMSYYAQCLCIDCSQYYENKVSSFEGGYEQLSNVVFGKIGKIITSLCLIISLFVANCVHISDAASLFHDIIEYFLTNDMGNYPFTKLKYAILYILMLALTARWVFKNNLKDLWKLGVTSTVVILITSIVLIIVLIVDSPNSNIGDKDNQSITKILGYKSFVKGQFWYQDIWVTAPDFAFMFMGSLFLFPIHNEMTHGNASITKFASKWATIITAICLFLVSVVVMFIYGENTKDNALYNEIPRSKLITVCTFFVTLMMILLYPVMNYVMLNSFEHILGNHARHGHIQSIPSLELNHQNDGDTDMAVDVDNEYQIASAAAASEHINNKFGINCNLVAVRRYIITVMTAGMVVVINAYANQNLWSRVYSVMLTIALELICYIIPCVLYLKTIEWNCKQSKTIGVFLILTINTIVMVAGTVSILINSANKV